MSKKEFFFYNGIIFLHKIVLDMYFDVAGLISPYDVHKKKKKFKKAHIYDNTKTLDILSPNEIARPKSNVYTYAFSLVIII